MELNDNTVLNELPLFSGIKENELKKYLTLLSASYAEYNKGEYIKLSGSPLESFGIVLSGSVNVCVDDIDGNRTIMATVCKGGTFGESLCLLEKASPVYIYATEKCRLLKLNCKNLFTEPVTAEKCVMQKRFTVLLATRTLEMNSRIQILSKQNIREKIIAYLSTLSKLQKSKTVTVPINREDMAVYIGANRSALSRELSKMKKEGIIDYYKNTFKFL